MLYQKFQLLIGIFSILELSIISCYLKVLKSILLMCIKILQVWGDKMYTSNMLTVSVSLLLVIFVSLAH